MGVWGLGVAGGGRLGRGGLGFKTAVLQLQLGAAGKWCSWCQQDRARIYTGGYSGYSHTLYNYHPNTESTQKTIIRMQESFSAWSPMSALPGGQTATVTSYTRGHGTHYTTLNMPQHCTLYIAH